MQPTRRTRATVRTMNEESALTNVLQVFALERNHVRDALLQGGIQRASDLKEFTFEDFGQLEYTQTAATTTTEAVTKHLTILQRRKLLLIPL
jgi:hypothetical protein